jgi:mannose-6-phosphate isomerase-like protein (cupin superfamily)
MYMRKRSRANAEHYQWGKACDGWHLVKHPEMSVIHERMPPGTEETRHYHERARQFFFVLSGVATMEIAGQTLELHPLEGIEVPPGVPHQMQNRSTQSLEFLVISQPFAQGDRVIVPIFQSEKA